MIFTVVAPAGAVLLLVFVDAASLAQAARASVRVVQTARPYASRRRCGMLMDTPLWTVYLQIRRVGQLRWAPTQQTLFQHGDEPFGGQCDDADDEHGGVDPAGVEAALGGLD